MDSSVLDDPHSGALALPAAEALAARLPRGPSGHYDELYGRTWSDDLLSEAPESIAASAQLAPAWASFFSSIGERGFAELGERQARLTRQIRENGVTYNVYADESNLQRPWPVDLFPLLVPAHEWAQIEVGIAQRVRVLDAVMADMYGPQRLLREGLIPPALVQGHPDYLRAMHGVKPVGGTYLHIVAFDLARGPKGNWWVVSQRTQAPSGLGYLLENRLGVSSQFPRAFERMHVRRLAATYRSLVESLKSMAPGGSDAHIALLTPGPYNETYFEQSYLARYLGVTLVEGSDLTVRDQKLYLKTLRGLQRVHALIRRVDDGFVDPLEMRADSRLGVPGLFQAVRAGNVLMANHPGAGFLESSALLGFLPALARHLLSEELSLPALHTWWCGEPAAREAVLPKLHECVIKPTYPWSLSRGTFNAGVGPYMGPEQLASWVERIRHNPDEHTVQAFLPASQLPTWNSFSSPAGIEPRAAILRVFALSDGPGSWQVLPGGMARLAGAEAGLASMQQGGSSADCWVLGEQPADEDFEQSTLAPLPGSITPLAARERLVTSRAAENLFWLGRYTERAENAARLARITLEALHGEEEPSYAMLMWLGQMAESASLVAEEVPSPLHWREEFERALITSLGDTHDVPSVGYSLRALRTAGAALRERLSPEHWNFIKDAEESFLTAATQLTLGPPSSQDTLHVLAQLSKDLAAITGAQNDRMWRDDGWRLLSIGRQIERLSFLAEALSRSFYTNAVHDAAGFGVVLNLFDSTISYHARYQRSRDIAALIEHIVLNYQNTRSLGWVIQTLSGRLARLHESEPPGMEDLSRRLRNPQLSELPQLCESNDIGDFHHLQDLLDHCIATAGSLSDEIGLRHFSHTGEARRSVGA